MSSPGSLSERGARRLRSLAGFLRAAQRASGPSGWPARGAARNVSAGPRGWVLRFPDSPPPPPLPPPPCSLRCPGRPPTHEHRPARRQPPARPRLENGAGGGPKRGEGVGISRALEEGDFFSELEMSVACVPHPSACAPQEGPCLAQQRVGLCPPRPGIGELPGTIEGPGVRQIAAGYAAPRPPPSPCSSSCEAFVGARCVHGRSRSRLGPSRSPDKEKTDGTSHRRTPARPQIGTVPAPRAVFRKNKETTFKIPFPE